ncbi:MAG: RNA polymerase sigma factor RpoD/SigA [Myxococcaceae bacterium]
MGRSPKNSGKRKTPKVAGVKAKREAEGMAAEPVEAEIVEPAEDELEEVDAADTSAADEKAAERGLSRRDPMAQYMAEVTRHSLLTREEEHALAVKYRESGDLNAAYRLVAANLRLVVKLAHEYHRNPLLLLDLIQEGNIGLMQAVKKYDPYRGVKLSSYAAWWIRAYILRYIMDNWKMVKLGTTEAQRKLFFKLRQAQEKLLSQGFEASPKLLAERLNVSEQDVVEMDQRLGHDEVSLDAPLNDESSSTRGDRLLTSGAMPADERLGNAQLQALFKEKLAEFAQTLKDEKERYIFEKRLTSDEPLTLQDIGTHYGVSRERARQVEAALIARMQVFMRERIPDFDWVAGEPRSDD